ncbi:MAG: Large ribosomal subunit accumulation protein YceD [Sporomusa sp.]|nr:Large ribosomal subunit accumulation protein YceD [Sporomusa sp.]
MKINIAQLRKDLGSSQPFSLETSARELGLDNQEIWADGMKVDGCIINKGMIFEIAGTIHATMNQSCSRCLEDMVTTLAISFSEEYREADFEKSDESLVQEINYFNGDEIDITDLIRENILLAEPIKPVCSESCHGLCPECGVNRNIHTCGCNSIKTDPRLAVLEKLLSKD